MLFPTTNIDVYFPTCNLLILMGFRYIEEDDFLVMAAYLDPRFKDLPYLDSSQRTALNSSIRQQMFRVHLQSASNSNDVELGKCD